jgi:hypothetical protein
MTVEHPVSDRLFSTKSKIAQCAAKPTKPKRQWKGLKVKKGKAQWSDPNFFTFSLFHV